MNERAWPVGFDPSLLRGSVIVLTGAGVSVDSGLATFRGAGGMYEGKDVTKLATPEGFAEDPGLVWAWYSARIAQVLAAEPNEGHFALARWAKCAESLTLITSNVDDLHERAGSQPYKLHGSILEARSTTTGKVYPLDAPPLGLPRGEEGELLRPNVVWFGERASEAAFSAFLRAIPDCSLFVEAGTSGQVSYGLTEEAIRSRVPVIRINPEAPFYSITKGVAWWREGATTGLSYLAQLACEG